MLRCGEHRLHPSRLDHLAILHHADAVGVPAHDRQIVADQQQSQPTRRLLGRQQLQDLRLDGDIQRRGRFVGNQQSGVVGKRGGDHHTLALAAGQLMRESVQPMRGIGKSNLAEQRDHLRPLLLLRQPPVQRHGLADLRADALQGVEAGHRLLEHHARHPAAQPPQHVVRRPDHGLTVQHHSPAAHPPWRQQLQQRERGERLARAALAHQCQRFTPLQGERDIPHHLALAEGHGQPLDRDQTHFSTLRGSNASRTASPINTSSVSKPPSTRKAVTPSQGACRLSLP